MSGSTAPSGSTALERAVVPLSAVVPLWESGSTARGGETAVSNYRGQIRYYRPTKFKNTNTNPNSLEAFSILLKPRSGPKSRDATAIAPRTLDWKSRQRETGNGGNTGIHGKRTRWGSIPPKETERSAPKREIHRSPPAAPVAGEKGTEQEGVRMGMGEKKLPLPLI